MDKNVRAPLKIFAIHEIQQRIRSPKLRKRVSSLFFKEREMEKKHQGEIGKLFKDGYLMLSDVISKNDIDRLIGELKRKKCIDRARPDLGAFSYLAPPDVTHTADINNITDIPEAIKLANSPKILEVVENYLGSKPIIDNIKAWWSIPGFDSAENEQFYHRDNDSIRFIKLFMYLTDVEEASGPHVFIKGSHISNNFLQRRRFSDEEVERAVDTSDKIIFTGKVGTCFLEDTYGVHKGTLPKSSKRLLIQVRYSVMPTIFLNKHKTSSSECKKYMYDAYINQYLTQS